MARVVTVVICCYTLARWELLKASIESVLRQTVRHVELVVVTDHNPELHDRLLSTFPALHVVQNQNRSGLSGARNSGVAAAAGEIVAFLDDDAAAEPEWLGALVRVYDDPEVLGAGGSIEPVWANGRPAWFPVEFDWVVGCTYRGMPTKVATVRNPIGANMSFRKRIFDDVGGFKDGLGRIGDTPVGGEETELCIRVARHDRRARIVYQPAARVYHHVPAVRGTWRYFLRRCLAEGMSKAAITDTVGLGAGLASERSYATRTLTNGVARGLMAGIRGDSWGPVRAAAIVIGFAVTAAGYLMGSLRPAALVAQVAPREPSRSRPH